VPCTMESLSMEYSRAVANIAIVTAVNITEPGGMVDATDLGT
jgi:hypothetical protein